MLCFASFIRLSLLTQEPGRKENRMLGVNRGARNLIFIATACLEFYVFWREA